VHNIGVTSRPVSHAVEGREDGVQLETKNPWLPTTKRVIGYKSYVQSAPKKSLLLVYCGKCGKTAGSHERDKVSYLDPVNCLRLCRDHGTYLLHEAEPFLRG